MAVSRRGPNLRISAKFGRSRTRYEVLLFSMLVVAPLCSLAFVSHGNGALTTRNGPSGPVRPAFVPTADSTSASAASRSTQLHSFMGSDGGILGIGTPELFTILLVGYFVLGPSDLYKLTKEIGKFVQNFRTFTAEATSTIENNFESQLQLDEIRKAQRELNEAFSFRRSINVDSDSDPFEVNAQSPREPSMPSSAVGTAVAATVIDEEAATQVPKKKIRRRRIMKKKEVPVEEEAEEEDEPFCISGDTHSKSSLANDVPDLSVEDVDKDMSESEESATRSLEEANEQLRKEAMEEEAAQRRKERMERIQQSAEPPKPEEEMQTANARFQAQLSGTWNDQILANGDELSPLASIMERLALLEEEKQAADERLQEEFRLREKNEERFYREKRKILEEAAALVQADAYLQPTNKDEVIASATATSKNTAEVKNNSSVAKA